MTKEEYARLKKYNAMLKLGGGHPEILSEAEREDLAELIKKRLNEQGVQMGDQAP